MDLRKTIILASECLVMAQVDHALIGGLALAVHGISRATADVDFLADGAKRDQILIALPKAGFNLINATREILQFQGAGPLDILLANRPLSRKMLDDAREARQFPVRALRVEDIIGLKIQAYCNDASRELRDKADIEALMLAHTDMDFSRVKTYADLFGQWATVDKLRSPK